MLIRRTLLGAALLTPALTASASAQIPLPHMPSLPLPRIPFLSDYDASPRDPHSYARPEQARVTHVSLDLTADFERKVLRGTATLEIERRRDAREIVLDIDALVIRSVRSNVGDTTWSEGQRRPERGAPLRIQLWPGAERIIIDYETSPDAGALQWLTPAQTASGKPFLFSQGQAILTRTWIPTQDSPGIRQTYDARIVAPADLTAVMSAETSTREIHLAAGQRLNRPLAPREEPQAPGERVFYFRMNQPIPPYLIALAVGDLEFRSVGERTGIYAEPSVIERAAYECADMERMLEAAEALYGDYRWDRYDILVLPPSFPYGGMENPRLTFLTPTFLAGDRSLVSLIAHEMAHSWSGNLVTNAVWADFWLNEGVTTYIEGRITETLYGADVAAMQYSLAWAEIQTALADNPPDSTRLHLIGERGAEDYVAAIAYDKGALFLRTIEGVIGRARMDAYLRSYFNRHAFQSITTERFLADFRRRVVRRNSSLEQQLQLDAWAYEPGLPSNAAEPRAAAFERVAQAVAAFNAGGPASAAPWSGWGTLERQRFLQTLPRTLPQARLAELESALDLNATGNSEVLFDWLALAVRNGYEPCGPALESFLTRQGRRKFVRPLYRALMEQGEWGQAFARRVYALARPGYHPVTTAAVDEIVTPPPARPTARR